jgi:redox-sensitive bicupin YhaK (pirin superfamily)
MQKIFYPATERGHNQFDWLNSYHSFSFGNFYNPKKMHFGALRVLNDDIVAPGTGFGTHPHEDMEIISIPLEGVLEHKDSMGNAGTIEPGDVQIMSAGTGIQHSEYNHSADNAVKFLQIWIFPESRGLVPSYDQKKFNPTDRKNAWQTLVSPTGDSGVKIHQQAWLSITSVDAAANLDYRFNAAGQGLYLFLLSGKIEIENTILSSRDALGIWEKDLIGIKALEPSELLAIEVPMEFL